MNDNLFEFIDLPQLQSVKLGDYALSCVHSVMFKSDGMDGLIIQICLNYNLFYLTMVLFMVMIEKLLAMNPTTTRTH